MGFAGVQPMITIDTAALATITSGAFTTFWQLVSGGAVPLSVWFVMAYVLLYNTKANPQSNVVARLKVTAAGVLLAVATLADLVRWASM